MAINAQMVKELREITGAGILDCKKALTENDGNLDKAVDFLREKGLAQAKKKSGRIAAEGLITKFEEGTRKVTMTEVNSETDFVAKNDKFKELTDKITKHAHDNNLGDAEALNASSIDGTSFDEFLKGQIATIGENLVVRKSVIVEGAENEAVKGYVHFDGRVGAIVCLECDSKETAEKSVEFASQLCMHISAMRPTNLDYTELELAFVEKEVLAKRAELEKQNEENKILGKPLKHIPEFGSMLQLTDDAIKAAEDKFKEELKAQGKPEKIWDKIIPGQIARYIKDNTQIDQELCLNSQGFVLDDSMTVKESVEAKAKELGGEIKIKSFVRFEVGEGIEKKEENFAEEVAKQMGN